MALRLGEGAWSWFADPRAVYFTGRHRRTFVGWIDIDGDVVVASFDHRSRAVERAVLRRALGVDDHNNPGLLMRADGRLTAFYCAHNGGHMYYRRTRRPEDVSSWGPERTLPVQTPGDRGHTYPNPLYLSDERRTYLFWRGGQYWPVFARHTDGNRWSRPRTLLRIPGQRPYLKLHDDGRRDIHIAYSEGNPGPFNTSVYYLRYRGDAFYRADGTRVAGIRELPLAPTDGQLIYNARTSGARAWVWDLATHPDHRPVVVYATFRAAGDVRYEYAEWLGDQWRSQPIIAAGGSIGTNYAPGITLDHEDPSVVFLSRRVGGNYEVQRWRTDDGGATWRHRALSHDMDGDGLRPISPRGRAHERDALWMQGRYRHYTDYRTAILARFAA